MPKRLFWMTTGYVSGAASSWWVQRRVKREVEKMLPNAVKNEVTKRVGDVGDRALDKTVHSPVGRTASKAVQRVRSDIDLTERAEARLAARQQPQLRVVDADLHTQPGVNRLRERARRFNR